jgi:hypothetical protein
MARKSRHGLRSTLPRVQPNAKHVDQWKPKGYEDWLTLGELSFEVDRHRDYLRRLERQERIPLPKRVTRGELEIRLYSPFMVKEIKEILSRMKPGKPRK